MFRITKQTDYGIVLVSHMAAEPQRQFTAPDLAAEAQLLLLMVAKILKLLTQENVLVSHRGVNGGYALARSPHTIAVSEVITALDGPIAMTECIDDDPGECVQELICPLRSNWQVINQAVQQALNEIKITDMAQPLPEQLVLLGQRRSLPPPPAAHA